MRIGSDGPPGVVLLSAGSGSRMKPLTDGIPKSLLKVGDRLVIDWMIDSIAARTDAEIVVVTGYAQDKVESHVSGRYGDRVQFAQNELYEQDVNILSVETGVSALSVPNRGYLIVETDLLLDEASWDTVCSAMERGESAWVCRGTYGQSLTGGIVHQGADGAIDGIEYQPDYDSRFDGWNKMLGMLLVGPGQVQTDRQSRQAAIKETTKQYYLRPWQAHVRDLPSRVVSLDGSYAVAFNTVEDFESGARKFLASHQDGADAK